jgi:hypothetical protein
MNDGSSIDVKESAFERVRFGRNRLLATAGGVLFGTFAGALGGAKPAWATCGDPSPCSPHGICCCCSGTSCCLGNCSPRHNECTISTWSDRCWNYCPTGAGGNRITCCDWYEGSTPCICRENTSPC